MNIASIRFLIPKEPLIILMTVTAIRSSAQNHKRIFDSLGAMKPRRRVMKQEAESINQPINE